MNVSTRHERRKQPIRRSVTSAIELYLGDMDGHDVTDLYQVVLSEVEPAIFDVVMKHVEGNQTEAAEVLGVSRGTLRKKLKLYGLCSNRSGKIPAWYCYQPEKRQNLATEEHGKINNLQEIFPCSSVDSVAMKNLARSLICTGTCSHQGPFE